MLPSSFTCWKKCCLLSLLCLGLSSVGQAQEALRQVIDAQVKSAWAKEKLTPAGSSTDGEFLRRVSLDVVGQIPTYAEAKAFLEDKDPKKREKLIDKLLADPRHAQHQADLWDLVLFGRNPPGYDTDKREGFQTWLVKQFADNVAYDQFVKKILKAEGNSAEDGALYYVQYKNAPEDASEAISQTFLGVQLQCARCHDHPYESWTQRDFYGMAAFLARLEVVQVGKKGTLNSYAIGERNAGDIQFTGPAKNQEPGKKGEPIKPKFLLGKGLEEPAAPTGKEAKFEANKMPAKPTFSRKDKFADWVAQAENPFFAKAIANRVWAQYLGRGLVHPVDNMSPSNKPSHPELLDKLAQGLVEHKFDLRWYTRELLNSQAYQLSAAGTGEAMPQWYNYARIRPLSAEELIESWRIAMGYIPSEKPTTGKAIPDRFRPLGKDYVIRYFGTPNTGTGDFQGGLHEHLYMNNGPLSQYISAKGGLAEMLADKKTPVPDRIDKLYLSTLTRPATDKEKEKLSAVLASGNVSSSDIVWALITSSEFRFNH